MDPIDELALLLRPAGGGVFLVSTGRVEQVAMQRLLYRDELEVEDGAGIDELEAAIRAVEMGPLSAAALARLRQLQAGFLGEAR